MNFQRVCGKIVGAGRVDLFFGCEVGGAREGFSRAELRVRDILVKPYGENMSGPFGEKFRVHEDDNYIAVFAFAAAVSVCLHGTPRKITLEACRDVDAVITCFDLKSCGASQPAVHVVVGNLHIVCDSNVKPPTLATRQRILKKLRDELQKYAAPQRHMSVVRLIVGDDNLSTEEAVQALQQEKDVKHC